MRNILNFKKLILFSAFAALIFTGCKDEEFLPGADRLFRPMINNATVSMTWIKLGWDKYKGAKIYEVQVSVDTFKTVLRTSRTDSTQLLFTGLDFDTKYQFRIQAIGDSIISTGDTIRSKFFETNLATLDYPTLLTIPTGFDVIDKSIRVKWKLSSMVYSRIDVMINKDSVYKSVIVTDADNLAGEKIIPGLQPQTSYIVKIFSGEDYRGKKTFKTATSQLFSGDVVDLRDSTDLQAQTILTQAYFDNLAILHPAGYNLILSGGVSYTLPTINISVPVNMVTGLSFKGKAIMAVNGSFGITTNTAAKVSKLRFEKIFFTQGTTAGKFKTDGNYGGTYLINMNQADGNVDTLIFENCDIKYKRGAIRMQAKGTIGLVKINNCVFDSIGGYGVVNNANDLSRINDIVVTNSTIAHADKLFVCGKLLSINSISISNITTCFAPVAGGYFLDYTTNAVPGGVTITNSVFGPGIYNTTTSTSAVNGMRFLTTALPNISVTNCFKTNDLTWAINATTLLPTAPINDFVDLGAASTAIFLDVTKSNYKVSDSKLVNKVGDPRWW